MEKAQDKASPAARKLTSIRRIIFWLLLSGVILIVGGHFLWGVIAGYSLNRAVARLHAAGEPTVAADLHLDDTPDAQNASLDYKAAAEALVTNGPAWNKFYDRTGDDFSFPLNEPEYQTIDTIISVNNKALTRVDSARGKLPGGWKDDFDHPSILHDLSDLNVARRLAILINARAIGGAQEHRDDLAAQSIGDGLLFSNALERRPYLLSHLVAVGCDALALENVTQLSARWNIGKNGLERPRLLWLLKLLQDETPVTQGDHLAFNGERMLKVTTLKDLADGTIGFNTVAGSTAFPPKFTSYLRRPTFRDDARLCMTFFEQASTAAAAPDWPTAQQRYPSWFDNKRDRTANLFLHVGARLLVPSVKKAIQISFRERTQRRLASVAVAFRLYAADHRGQLPVSLADLVPAYLPSIPINLTTGNTLLFRSDPPRVYSPGVDGIDHGGVSFDPHKPWKLSSGDVVVYLTPHPRGYHCDAIDASKAPPNE